MTKIIDGKLLASRILDSLKDHVQSLKTKPSLAIVLASPSSASRIYVNNKIKAAQNIGIKTRLIELKEDVEQRELIKIIQYLNGDSRISGIIAQLPLYNKLDSFEIIETIDPSKDVDGLTTRNIGLLYSGRDPLFIPCTPLGIYKILEEEYGNLRGLSAVIIGRSNIVGRPLASLLLKNDVTVTICHSKSKNTISVAKNADIVVTASGRHLMFGREYFSPNSVVIDVGINKTAEGKIVGDVRFEEVSSYVRAITKVPGGVGPMTIACLMQNVVKAHKELE
ncbi:MAG: bifunctional 5,10-methylenetetrahydrofolate dehydrogenase/5,10-methenyltetrahydrofolate cyclohydrolase [Rickettsiaceae bacterium]|nr:bifunctional 5,10-methylenetetrahydrofolate dehydrogenase/5,10-methenyltetrahydrofolate cyclohydrolase [Rickettsiaceae bacterium]